MEETTYSSCRSRLINRGTYSHSLTQGRVEMFSPSVCGVQNQEFSKGSTPIYPALVVISLWNAEIKLLKYVGDSVGGQL